VNVPRLARKPFVREEVVAQTAIAEDDRHCSPQPTGALYHSKFGPVSVIAGYIALVHKDEGTSYGVSFPDVPGCIAAGDTFEEAVANAAEALAGHFALMKADGDVIPAARTFEQLRHDPEFVEDSADAIVTMVTPRTEMAPAE